MEKDSLLSKIKEIVSKFAGSKDKVRISDENTDIFRDLGVDSARSVDITLDLEEEFQISIDDNEAQKMRKMGDIVRIVQERLKGKK